MFGPFRSIAASSFDRISPGNKISLEAGFGRIVFLSAVFVVFHSRDQSILIPVPPFIRPLWLQGLYPHTLFLGSKCWIFPMPIHTMWNQGTLWKGWCKLEVFSWMLWFITKKKGAVSSKFLILFIMLPFSWELVFVGLPSRVWCLRGQCLAFSSGFREPFPHVSLFTKDDDRAKTATAQCCFWQKSFRHFRSIATSNFDGIYPWSKHCIGGWFGQILFLSAVLIVFHSR